MNIRVIDRDPGASEGGLVLPPPREYTNPVEGVASLRALLGQKGNGSNRQGSQFDGEKWLMLKELFRKAAYCIEYDPKSFLCQYMRCLKYYRDPNGNQDKDFQDYLVTALRVYTKNNPDQWITDNDTDIIPLLEIYGFVARNFSEFPNLKALGDNFLIDYVQQLNPEQMKLLVAKAYFIEHFDRTAAKKAIDTLSTQEVIDTLFPKEFGNLLRFSAEMNVLDPRLDDELKRRRKEDEFEQWPLEAVSLVLFWCGKMVQGNQDILSALAKRGDVLRTLSTPLALYKVASTGLKAAAVHCDESSFERFLEIMMFAATGISGKSLKRNELKHIRHLTIQAYQSIAAMNREAILTKMNNPWFKVFIQEVNSVPSCNGNPGEGTVGRIQRDVETVCQGIRGGGDLMVSHFVPHKGYMTHTAITKGNGSPVFAVLVVGFFGLIDGDRTKGLIGDVVLHERVLRYLGFDVFHYVQTWSTRREEYDNTGVQLANKLKDILGGTASL